MYKYHFMKRITNTKLLKKLMKENGTEPVEEMGVSISILKKLAYDNYPSKPKPITMRTICDAYNVRIDELFLLFGGLEKREV